MNDKRNSNLLRKITVFFIICCLGKCECWRSGGNMAVVYMAEQKRPIRRKVALIRIYNYALKEDEIKSLYESGSSGLRAKSKWLVEEE